MFFVNFGAKKDVYFDVNCHNLRVEKASELRYVVL